LGLISSLCAFESLCLCEASLWDCVKNPRVFALNHIAFAYAYSADHSRTSAETTLAIGTRRQHASIPRHQYKFGGISRAIRGTKMSIQRFAPVNPPVMSAE